MIVRRAFVKFRKLLKTFRVRVARSLLSSLKYMPRLIYGNWLGLLLVLALRPVRRLCGVDHEHW